MGHSAPFLLIGPSESLPNGGSKHVLFIRLGSRFTPVGTLCRLPARRTSLWHRLLEKREGGLKYS
jgi:hypothetical protein